MSVLVLGLCTGIFSLLGWGIFSDIFGDFLLTMTDKNGKLLYRLKECVDEFPYTYTNEKREIHLHIL